MFALFKLIPGKDLFYGAIIAALLAAFGWYTIHERDIGARHVVAKMTVVAHKTETKLRAVVVTAQKEETTNAQAYNEAVAHDHRRNLGIVCVRNGASSDGRQLPGASGVATSAAGNNAANVRAAAPYDPSGAVLQVGAEADAEIAYLQARVHELEQAMEKAHKETSR